MSPWVPITDPVQLALLGKLGEELGEAMAALSRSIIQGLDGKNPATGEVNIQWLAEEAADVAACIMVLKEHQMLVDMPNRTLRKRAQLYEWLNLLPK